MRKYASDQFIQWLNNEISKRNWSMRQTAREAGLSHTVISNVLNGGQPTFDTCAALAEAFNLPAIDVFKIAGLVDDPFVTSYSEAAIHKFSQLPEWQQKIIVKFMDSLIEEKGENEDTNPQVANSHA